jgi:hypothetical protein
MILFINDIAINGGNRVGQQEDFANPLVGIWGEQPALTEYRIVGSADSLYYMEITEPYNGVGVYGQAIRIGTYLLRQIDGYIFETVSAFPEGRFRVEIRNDRRTIILVPLFTLPEDEDGNIAPFYRIVREESYDF